MNKRLITIIIISISLFGLIFAGIYSYKKYEKKSTTIEENTENYNQDEYIIESEITIEDVIDKIKLYYIDNESITVVYNEEKNGYWYFSDSNNNKYKYSIFDGEIKVIN